MRICDDTAAGDDGPPAGGKRQLIREGGSASRVSDHALPRDPGGGTVPTVSPRRTIIDDISQAVEQSGGGPQLVSSGGSTVWTEKTLAEDTRECPHDVVGLRPHKGTMWMSNNQVPLKNIESPYGGGVSSLPGAAGDLSPVMFPVTPVLLAGGPQLGPWQVAVVRVEETPAGDSSEREYPCAIQSRHRPIDIYELPDCLAHTVVEGGPAGPEVIEPLELLVLDHADPAGQHAVIRDTTILLEHPLTRPESSLGDGLGSRRHVRFRTLPWTVDLWRRLHTWSIWLRGCLWTVDPWRGCRVWNHWSSRFFIHRGLHVLVNVFWRKDQSGSR